MKKIQFINNDEHLLIEACSRFERTAQKKLYELYNNMLLTICIRYLKDEDEAQDVLNTAFLKIFSKINRFKAESKLKTWMVRITINTIIDHIRKNKNYRKNFIRTDEFSLYGEPRDEETDLNDWWGKTVSIPSSTLYSLIEELPPATRIVFNLFAIEDYSHKQIAKSLKISEGTSKWHLSNARKILKEKIINIINANALNNEKRIEKY